MDPFEVRMQFIQFLRRLNASVFLLVLPKRLLNLSFSPNSQPLIQKVVSYAIKNFECKDDIWDCIIEET
ncbi:LOW QUALITY PROTEIN: hypothetical protein CVT25_009581 [Psilocybe cyanescens]|uniref:CTD kinase subunit gamma Ctk3 N-terminal domain-containing protein n=1 Tax=Psilocybe cyanescens TaxID=93625 RepID=A0A409WWP2_PSICY|nr:LOW QUALITY PROTEIN: hypothetical protein CVT25_009581 [Psilocybe cyanescens]